MKQLRSYVDDRLTGSCVFCDRGPDTRDHVPPRVFLDDPYPENLPVVASCRSCNEGASLDEEYVACLLEVAACGSARPWDVERPKIAQKLAQNASLADRLANSFVIDGGREMVVAETDRVSRVLEKTARALWSFEVGDPTFGVNSVTRFVPVTLMDPLELSGFIHSRAPQLLPEVGSRALQRLFDASKEPASAWQDVQQGRFSYAIQCFPGTGRVKMMVRDFLAAEVDLLWQEPADEVGLGLSVTIT